MGGEISPSGSAMRAGAYVLLMATSPIKRGILREVLQQPLAVGGGNEFRITPGGREMLFVAFVAERWLQSAPHGPLDFDSGEAERVVRLLVEGWSSTLVHALAAGPLTLAELDRAVEGVGRRGLQRQLESMRDAGQVEVRSMGPAETAYAPTTWLRTGTAPLAAAARLERRTPKEAMVPIAPLDVEAAFQLTLPLLELPAELSGTCRLGVNVEDVENSSLTGVTVRIEAGRVVSCSVGFSGEADAWAAASASDWLDTLIEPDAKRIRTGGDKWLSAALLKDLHRKLFGVPVA